MFKVSKILLIFKVEIANEMYDVIKEGGSTQILGHLIRVLTSSYFFTLSHLYSIYS